MSAFELAGRLRARERMETEAVAVEDFARCLADIDRLAGLGRGHPPTLDWIARIGAGREALTILDVGSGGGAMLRRIARWAEEAGIRAELIGIDLDPAARVIAERATEPGLPIRYVTGNALEFTAGQPIDLIISAHLAHHLQDAELVGFLHWMDRTARLGWFVNDLHRHPVAYWTLRTALPVLPFHRFVVSDAPVSVRRAFVRADWEKAIAAAELDPARIEVAWHWPFRWGVGTRPDAPR